MPLNVTVYALIQVRCYYFCDNCCIKPVITFSSLPPLCLQHHRYYYQLLPSMTTADNGLQSSETKDSLYGTKHEDHPSLPEQNTVPIKYNVISSDTIISDANRLQNCPPFRQNNICDTVMRIVV